MNALASPVIATASLLELNPGLMLWTAITFLVLVYVLGKFAFRPIVKMLDERERTIREAIERAERERAEAEQMLAAQKESLHAAHREAAELAKRSAAEVERLRQELTARARKEAEELVVLARTQIQEERAKAVAELRGQVADMAIDVAKRLIPQAMDEKTHRTLVEEYVRQLPGAKA
jgi:F-type H+-transporting ATPase subunit b